MANYIMWITVRPSPPLVALCKFSIGGSRI